MHSSSIKQNGTNRMVVNKLITGGDYYILLVITMIMWPIPTSKYVRCPSGDYSATTSIMQLILLLADGDETYLVAWDMYVQARIPTRPVPFLGVQLAKHQSIGTMYRVARNTVLRSCGQVAVHPMLGKDAGYSCGMVIFIKGLLCL